ncbi:MAG TPA: zinc-binding alcohol dehydrogenase family protein [Bradyrhizobium sp.]|nr:zinc-binding alcohol dehydrogenase family protein [Bradyrhizobium sp.]
MPTAQPGPRPPEFEARCVRLNAKAEAPAAVAPVVERRTLSRGDDHVLIEIKAAAVNPSDVKAATGLMAYAVFPRTSGRDYAGVVIDGPAGTIGREVFGSSGDLGIRCDGTHATHLVVEADAVVEKPMNLSWAETAGIGVPFVTAIEGFRRAGMPKSGETVLVMGVTGKVGQAAVQIASWRGARVIGVARKQEAYVGHTNAPVEMIDSSMSGVAERVRELTDGKGADIVFNTVGDPYFEAAHKSLGLRGRQILIAAIDRIVQFNILEFYRGQHSYFGIDTLGLSSVATGAVLRELVPGFLNGHLKPFAIRPNAIYPLEDARAAFLAVAGSSRDRIILRP